MPSFPQAVRGLLSGTPFGELYPPKTGRPFLAIDGRTAALHVLREYVTNLVFYRSGGPMAPPIAFSIKEANFHIEWPDYEVDEVSPSIAIVSSRANYDVIGLVSYIEEETRDVYGQGTVLQWQAEYVETINLEVMTAKKAERRAILAGLETSFSPTEQYSGLRFRMPEYYDELVCFTLNKREVMDDPDSAKNRRKAQLEMEMRFNIVALVNYQDAKPVIQVNVDANVDTGTPVDLSTDPNARVVGDLASVYAQTQAQSVPGTIPNPAFDE